MELSDVMLAGIFTLIGAGIGFLGTLIQSFIGAKNNKELLKLEGMREIEMHRYSEKEKLYSDIISFLPEFEMSIDYAHGKHQLSNDCKIMLNSFKARLSLYSSKDLYEEFYRVVIKITEEYNEQRRIELMDNFTEKLLEDLKNI